jgi:hypothetical protein
MQKSSVLMIILAAGMVAASVFAFTTIRRGFSALDNPSALETIVARAMRRFSIPATGRNAKNPFPPTPEFLREARAHFADHCAPCHGNNGSGKTQMGRNLYPKAPDMRLSGTQHFTDGELYYVIHNGIRLSGMPAWGGQQHSDDDSWKLVLFIRHLPELSPEEETEMQTLNPKSPGELKEEQDEHEFLNDGIRTSRPQLTNHHR